MIATCLYHRPLLYSNIMRELVAIDSIWQEVIRLGKPFTLR